MPDLNAVTHNSKFFAKLRQGLAAARPATPVGIGDHYYATDTSVLSLTTNGASWDIEKTLGVGFKGVQVKNTSNQTINTGTASNQLFTSEDWDTNSFHDNAVNTSRLTAVFAGKYWVYALANAALDSIYPMYCQINVNGGTSFYKANSESIGMMITLVVNDYVELTVGNASGSNATFNPVYFGMEYRGD